MNLIGKSAKRENIKTTEGLLPQQASTPSVILRKTGLLISDYLKSGFVPFSKKQLTLLKKLELWCQNLKI
jgi:hypothetical protein